MNPWLLLAIAIVAETIATSTLKVSAGMTRLIPAVIVVVFYAISFYLLSRVLYDIPIGVTYAIWSGIGIVLVTVVGLIAYGQRLDIASVVGIILILAGVLVMNLLSNSSVH